MERLTLKTKELSTDYQIGDISLSSQVDNIMNFYGIPQALRSVDKKFNTNTLREVIEVAAPTIDVLVDENSVQVLDPKSVFMGDNEFYQLLEVVQNVTGVGAKVTDNKFQKQAEIQLKERDSDSFLGDVFSRNWSVIRRAEGGLSFSTGILRLACTNGMVIPDKQFSGFIRNATADQAFLTGFHDTALGFSVDAYMRATFMHNGEYIPCSLADMYEMHDCLAQITQDDLADMLYPLQTVEEFYTSQGIDVAHLSRRYLDKLPTGFTYYQALNILTNGAKAMADKTIDNQVKVAKFCQSKRIQSMKDVDLHWEGMLSFSNAQIHALMGDGQHSAPVVKVTV